MLYLDLTLRDLLCGCAQPYVIGRRGTAGVLTVRLDYSDWVRAYGSGVITLMVKPYGAGAAYPVMLDDDHGLAAWLVSISDTQTTGVGQAEFIFHPDASSVDKSAVFSFSVLPDIGRPLSEIPDAYADWVSRLEQLGAETLVNAQDAAGSASDAATAKTAAEAAQEAAEGSERAAAGSATDAAESAEAALDAKNAAEAAQEAAEGSAQAAEGSAQAAEGSAQAAEGSATAAAESAEAAQEAKTAAEAAQEAAEGSERAAAGSATDAAGSAEAALDAKTAAEAAAQSVSQSAAQISQNASDISDLKSAVDQKAPAIYDTASGAIASFEDGADGMTLKSLTVNIEPVQSGSGDPSPENVRPISGWAGANVTRTGVNVWDEEWEAGTINPDTGANRSSTWSIRSKNKLLVAPSETYYVVAPYNITCYWYGADDGYLGSVNVTAGTTFTIPRNVLYMRLSIGTSSNPITTYNNDISINYPSTDHAYHPHAGNTYTISWQTEAGTVYGGTLTINGDGSGTLEDALEHINLGSLTWTYESNNQRFKAGLPILSPEGSGRSIYCLCDCYATKWNGESYDPNWDYVAYVTSTATVSTVWVHDHRFNNSNDLKSALANKFIVYPKRQETTYTLTAQQVIETLKGLNNIWADCGDVEVEYKADTKLYIQKINAPADDDMTADAQIASGKYFIIGNNLYLSTTTIPAGDTIIPGTNCQKTDLAAALNALNT